MALPLPITEDNFIFSPLTVNSEAGRRQLSMTLDLLNLVFGGFHTGSISFQKSSAEYEQLNRWSRAPKSGGGDPTAAIFLTRDV